MALEKRITRGFRTYGLLLALGLAVGAYFLGAWVGQELAAGFQADWYLHEGLKGASPTTVATVAALGAVALALVVAPVAAALAFGLFDFRTRKLRFAREVGMRSRDVHALRLVFVLGIVVPATLGLLVFALLSGLGITRVSASGVRDLVALAAAGATFFAAYFAFAPTGDALRTGVVAHRNAVTENAFAKIAIACARHAKATLAVILVGTLLVGYGMTYLNTNVDAADVLPRGDPNTVAAKNLTSKFKSTFTQQVTFMFHVDETGELWAKDNARLPYRQTPPTPGNVSDEVYIRAIDEANEFIKSYPGAPFRGSVSLPDFYRLINWTLAGGTRAAESTFTIPGTDPQGEAAYAIVNRSLYVALYDTADAVASPSWRQTSSLINVAPTETMDSKEIGQWALKVRDAYVQWAEANPQASKVFTGANAPKFSVDLPIANAHSSELAAHDFKTLIPPVAAFILVSLFIAFRSKSAIVIAFSALAASVVWTFGIMGYMRIPLNTLNLTTIPLIMGVGIDYGIHMMNEYTQHRASGQDREGALRLVGQRGAVALFIATLTTAVGLLVMVVSPSLLIAQLGLLAAIAMTLSFLMTITLIPAAVVLAGDSARAREYRTSPFMANLASIVSRHRVLTVVAMLLVSSAAYAATSNLQKEAFGDPPRNWLDDDPLRAEHEAALRGFYDTDTDDVKANILIFEGDIYDPAAHRYMDRLEEELKKQDLVVTDTLRTLPFLVRTYLTVRDGGPGAGEFLLSENLAQRGAPSDPYPTTREEIRALLKEIPETPLRGFAGLFYDFPEDEMAIMLFSARAATYEQAEEVWFQVHDAIAAAEEDRPEGLQVAMFGNTAINYLFVAKELPWVTYMSVATNLLVIAFVYISTRKIRPTVVVGLLNLVTSLWWLALLPSFGVGLAITLTLPLVFIYAIGSDYGLHLIIHMEETRDPYHTFETTGKAVLFSAISTFGAFVIFTQMSNLAVQRTMIGTSLAIPVIFIVTMLIVPLFYPARKKKALSSPAHEAGVQAAAGEGMRAVPVQAPRRGS